MSDQNGNPPAESAGARPRSRLSQEDVPGYSLDQALRVAQAIADSYAYNPTRPLNVAQAMGFTPSSGGFRGMTGAAVAYGLTNGAYNSAEIALTPIGLRIVRPTAEGDDIAARREALLKPRVVGEFLRDYDGAALPSDAIAKNVLREKGVPAERLDGVLELIVDGAKDVGFIKEWSGKRYVDLTAAGAGDGPAAESAGEPAGTQAVPLATTAVQTIGPSLPATVSVGAGVHINIEIHIAADASSQTVEDIFKNMRRYVLRPDTDNENVE